MILSGNRTFNAASGNLVVGGLISGSGFGIIKTGNNSLTLNNIGNSYTGLTDVQVGTLALGASDVLANASTLKVSGGILSLTDKSDTVAGVQLTAGSITGTTGVLTSTTAFDLQAGSVSAILGGSVGATKTTAGTVTLSGVNTYTGQTTISGGQLALGSTGSINNSSGVALNNGNFNVSAVSGGYTITSLVGNGSVTGDLTASSNLGVIASLDTITFNDDLTLGGSSVSKFDIGLAFATFDLAASGLGSQTVNFGGALNLDFASGFNTIGSVQIFDFNFYNGNFTSLVSTGLASGFTATFDQATGFVNVVPEPAAALLGSLGTLLLLRRRRQA